MTGSSLSKAARVVRRRRGIAAVGGLFVLLSVGLSVVKAGPPASMTSWTLASALGASATFALALAFGCEYLDDSIRTPADVMTALGVPWLTSVPYVPRESGGVSGGAAAPDNPAGVLAHALDAVQDVLLTLPAARRARSIAVTSAGAHEGKTFIASRIAVALAAGGHRTLAIDADFHRSRLHAACEVPPGPGLWNVLMDELPWGAVVRGTGTPNLFILTAGTVTADPVNVLHSTRYTAFRQEIARHFDWIVMDAPPVLSAADGQALSRHTDGLVFVIASEVTPRIQAQTALARLTAAGGRVVGAVLNHPQRPRLPTRVDAPLRAAPRRARHGAA